jgi:hypothetical protein
VTRGTKCIHDLFDRAQTFSTTPGHNGWTIADTSASGSPTYAVVTEDGGAARLALAATSEVENVCLYQNDILTLDLAKLHHVSFVAKVATVGANSVVTFGIGSARADDEDAVAVNAFFKIEGATDTAAIVVETDDGVTDNNDVATGQSLAAVYKKFTIDFTNGLSDVRFYIDGERVAAGTTFDMSGITAGQNVQLMAQVSKASSTDTPTLDIAEVKAQYNYAYGA